MRANIGAIISGTLRPGDLIPAFVSELRYLDQEREYSALCDEADNLEDYDVAEDVLSELFDALNAFAPPYCYFGAHPSDGACFGFWLVPDWQQLKEDGV